MKILIDENLPRNLAAHLEGHECRTVAECGWSGGQERQVVDSGRSAVRYSAYPRQEPALPAESGFGAHRGVDPACPFESDSGSAPAASGVSRRFGGHSAWTSPPGRRDALTLSLSKKTGSLSRPGANLAWQRAAAPGAGGAETWREFARGSRGKTLLLGEIPLELSGTPPDFGPRLSPPGAHEPARLHGSRLRLKCVRNCRKSDTSRMSRHG